MSKNPLTEQQPAPDTEFMVPLEDSVVEVPPYTPPPRAPKRIERQGQETVPYVHRYPQIRAGVCEFCGVLDPYTPGDQQYKLCPHYRGMEAQCSYCDAKRNPKDVVASQVMNVAEHPNDPNTIIMWCNSFPCIEAHSKRFKVNK